MTQNLNGKSVLLVAKDDALRGELAEKFRAQGAQVEICEQSPSGGEWQVLLWVACAQASTAGADLRFAELVEALGVRAKQGGFARVIRIVYTQATQQAGDSAAFRLRAAGLRSTTQSEALRCAPTGMTINMIELGLVEGVNGTDPLAGELLKRVALARPVTPAEVAAATAFLASPESNYTTGACLPVTGGAGLGLFPEQLR
ncbi:MAG: hypothetical protein ACI9F9_002174 [Candidatus Paceibacteria bacterium]|jgi:hypothetical protein